MEHIKYNSKIVKAIYRNICPILIWIQNIKNNLNRKDGFKRSFFYQLIKEMRNSASHLDINNTEEIQALFINIVLIYRKFDVDVVNQSNKVKKIWNDLYQSAPDKCCKFKFKNSYKNPKDLCVDNRYNNQSYYNLFKNILLNFVNPHKTNFQNIIDLVYRFSIPLILWNEIMINTKKRNKGTEIEQIINDSILFKIGHNTRNNICHLSNTTQNASNERFCEEILKTILVIYQSFGLDLRQYVNKIKEINFDTICLPLRYTDNYVGLDIRTVISNRSNRMCEYYFTFGKWLHYLVTKDLTEDHFITKVFCDDQNILEWDKSKKMFTKKCEKVIIPDDGIKNQRFRKTNKCKYCLIIFILLGIYVWYLTK